MRWLDGITGSMDMSSGDSEGWACCSAWGRRKSDTTEQMNNTSTQDQMQEMR